MAFKGTGVTDAGTTPTTATLDTENNRKMSLDLSKWVRDNQANKGKEFTVTYYAKVNTNAEVTNNNKASLEYGNNPDETTTTTPSEAKTNTYPLGIIELVYIVLQSVVKPGITGFFKIDLHIKCYIYLS